ncbi:hypothetical protein EX30DRAFT_374356 [Ascodesmis nigricans]|uniref:CRIB domain-containing protein n=1 Tax=Ascodesmis nigricans TaxID=341454 RepID=A0A4S2MLE3_9PEZI|nr:hypothetical protein EX30DRAFT_374356 [Ascodesmis nigricans]
MPSTSRTSFFGGKRRTTVSTMEHDAPPIPRSPLLPDDDQHHHHHHVSRPSTATSAIATKLRKVSSRSKLTEEEKNAKRKTRGLGLGDALKPRHGSHHQSATTRLSPPPISEPFDFAHISHHDPNSAPPTRDGADWDLGQEWNRVLHRESQIRPLRTQASMNSLHSRSNSTKSVGGARHRAGSMKSISPTPQMGEYPAYGGEGEDMMREGASPLVRSGSTHCLRIQEHPEESEDHYSHGMENDVCHAVTTMGDSTYGRMSVGIEKLVLSPRLANGGFSNQPTPQIEPTDTEQQMNTKLKDTGATEDKFPGDESQQPGFQTFLSVRPRPLSQMSAVSDTLNGSFTVAAAPITRHASIRSRQQSLSRYNPNRRSAAKPNVNGSNNVAGLESWEQDIDWIYSHEADADCDFDWGDGDEDEQSSMASSKVSHPLSPAPPSSQSPLPQATAAIIAEAKPSTRITPPPKSPLRSLSTSARFQKHRQNFQSLAPPLSPPTTRSEKRITGLFEDRLLLPLSPITSNDSTKAINPESLLPPSLSPPLRPSTAVPASTRDDELLIKAAHTAVHVRSPSLSSTNTPILPTSPTFTVPQRSYREELSRAARTLDDHIASLNRPPYIYSPPRIRSPVAASTISPPVSPRIINTSMIPEITTTTSSPAAGTTIFPSPVSPHTTTPIHSSQLLRTTRSRANSESTCGTLLSDSDTVTPTSDPNEAITPNSSAHNSFQSFHLPMQSPMLEDDGTPTPHMVAMKGRNPSVVGAGMGVEVRVGGVGTKAGLMWPARVISGVVEIGPGDDAAAAVMAEEGEGFVHYI